MSSIFEAIKNEILVYFFQKKEKDNKQETHNDKFDQDETISLVDDFEKNIYNSNNQKQKNFQTPMFTLRTLPYIYIMMNFSLFLMFLMSKDYSEVSSNYINISIHFRIFDFFKIYSLHPFLFNALNFMIVVFTMLMMIGLYFMERDIAKKMKITLYWKFTLIVGLLTNFLNLGFTNFGLLKLVNNYFNLSNNFYLSKLSENQFTFLICNGINLIYQCSALFTLNRFEQNIDSINLQSKICNSKYHKLKYCFIIHLLLTYLYLSYIFVYLHSNNLILQNFKVKDIELLYKLILSLYPYLIFVLNILFLCFLCDDLKKLNIVLSQDSGLDQVIYESSNRNTL